MESGLLLLVVQKKRLTNEFGQNKISRMKKTFDEVVTDSHFLLSNKVYRFSHENCKI